MKTVIRNGVFETNSSSTHALAIVKTGEKCDIDVSFEICSPVAKVFMIFGLVENARRCTDKGCRGWPKELMQRFKEAAVTALAESEGISRKDALKEIECEAFGDTQLKKALGDEAKLRKLFKERSQLAAEFKASKSDDIVAFAEEYFKRDLETTKKMMEGRYCCDAYFYNGCLIECNCGFETFRQMTKRFGIDDTFTDEMLLEKARELLSADYRIVAEEYNAGVLFMETGETY